MRWVVALVLLFLVSCQPVPGKTISTVNDQGNVQVFFCPRDDCEQQLLSFLTTATTSIHCAFYDLTMEHIVALLAEKSKTIDVSLIIDSENQKKLPDRLSFPVKADGSYGLMHDKFCIVDGKRIVTGSLNPTKNGALVNNNNLIFSTSPLLAQNYEQEFFEMRKGIFKGGDSVPNPTIHLNDIILKNYFCPEDHCAEQVEEELRKAKESIDFMTFSFTHNGIANVLLLKHQQNVTIRGVMEKQQIGPDSLYPTLAYQLETVQKDGNPRLMHHKVFIIDRKTVITGSFNPTRGGDERNDENVLIITNPDIAQQFTEEFERMWKEAQNEE